MDSEPRARLARTIGFDAGLDMRLDAVVDALRDIPHRPTVVVLSSLMPAALAPAHTRDMIALAGGQPLPLDLNDFAPSDLDDIIQLQPECLLFAPTAGDVETAILAFAAVAAHEAWRDIPASYLNQVICIASGLGFDRACAQSVDGIEVLGGLLHPNRLPHPVAGRAIRVQPFPLDGH